MNLEGPAVVTGAASGMGRRLAERWAARGITVVAADVSPGPIKELEANGTVARAVEVDVRDADAVARAAGAIAEEFGPVRTLVNGAGIVRVGRFDSLEPADFRAVMEVNYLGTVHWIHAVLPAMQAANRGTIVNFASLAGWMPTPITSAYTASKFAVVGLTETLAAELRRTDIRVTAVCPPAVDTPMLDSIRDHPHVPDRITRLVPPITADEVIDSIEQALERGRLFAFPGRGSTMLWRLRRFAPRLLRLGNRIVYGL